MFFKFLDENCFLVFCAICVFMTLFFCVYNFTMDVTFDDQPRFNGVVVEKGVDKEGVFVVVAYDFEYKGAEHSATEKYHVSAAEYISLSVDDIIFFDENNKLVIPWMEVPIE